jgi:hypothetical protein
MTITEGLLKAIESHSESLYRLSKDSGIDYGTLHRFTNRERTLTLDTADRLAEFLELELKPKPKTKPRAKRR